MPRGACSRLTDRSAAALIFVVSAMVLAVVNIMQHGFDIEPCKLCLLQRYPYWFAVVVSAAVILQPGKLSSAGFMVMSIAFAAGAIVGGYHVGIEQHWWDGGGYCTSVDMGEMSEEDLYALIMATPPPSCDVIAWSLLGISLAGYNVISAVAMALFCGFKGFTSAARG